MKTQMIKLLLVTGFLVLAACSKTGDDRGWTATVYTQVVSGCVAEYVKNDPNNAALKEEASKYCDCYMTAVRAKYSYSEYSEKYNEIDQEFDRAGVCQTP